MATDCILTATRDAALGAALRAQLERMGYAVVGPAADAAEVLRLAQDRRPRLAILDVHLEAAGAGIAVAEALRQQGRIPFLFLIDPADVGTLPRAKAAAPLGFIRKPLDPAEVEATVRLAFDTRWIEQRLQESDTRFRRLVESMTDYMYTVTVADGRAVSTTHGPACVSVTGYLSEDYHADPDLWFKMVYPDDRPRVLEQARRLLAGEAPPPLEHRILHKDGRVLWIRNRTVPHRDAAGRLTFYDGLVSDITERKQAELQIREHARRLEVVNRVIAAVNRATDLTALLDEVLSAAQEWIGFRSGCIHLVDAGRAMADLVSARGLPDEYRREMKRVNLRQPPLRAMLGGPEGLFVDDYRAYDPARAARWGFQALALVPLMARDALIGSLALMQDQPHAFAVEERDVLLSIGRQIGTAIDKMRSEWALRESEAKYRTITEQSLLGVHMIRDGRMVFVNEAWSRITGYAREEVAAWGVEDFGCIADPAERGLFLDELRACQLGPGDNAAPVRDCRFRSKTGAPKWVLLQSRAVAFADGRAVVGILVDITDRKAAEEALAAANRQLRAREQELLAANRDKEVLLKEIHHRVKNNLQVVSSLLKLQAGQEADPRTVAAMRECQNRIRSIAIVHEHLYQSRNLAEVDLGRYLQRLVTPLFRALSADPSAIGCDMRADGVMLPIDQAIPCSLIINELVSNALKYAFPENRRGAIRIRLSDSGGERYRLEVADDGVGLPATLDFRQSPSLGLQLVMTFVAQLGGAIERLPGPGTGFAVTFPAGRKKAAE